MMSDDVIIKAFEEVTDAVKDIGWQKVRQALLKARSQGITMRDMDYMTIICAEFDITPEKVLVGKDKTLERYWATAFFVHIMVVKMNKSVKQISTILRKSRVQIYRYMKAVDNIQDKHKSTAWLQGKKQRFELLFQNITYGD
jgi:hypothetical protein